MSNDHILEAVSVRKDYEIRLSSGWSKSRFSAIQDINFSIGRGETVCIIGESGCGKSTLARVLSHLSPPSGGVVRYHGRDLNALRGSDLKNMRKNVQFIFQDPYASLNPRLTLGQIIAEPLENFTSLPGAERRARAYAALRRVGLRAADIDRYPSQLSGGQRQRVGIARAIVADPSIIIADEAVSALDVSVKAQILNLLIELQYELGIAYVFITHDVSVVHNIADRVVVMYLGRIVESGDARSILKSPSHPYTQMLLSAVPTADPRRPLSVEVSRAEIPSAMKPPSGCVFRTRCFHATSICGTVPTNIRLPNGVVASCHHLDEAQQAFLARRMDTERKLE